MNLLAIAVADCTGFMLLVALLVSSRIRRSNNDQLEIRVFTVITVLTLVACAVDLVVFLVDGRPGTLMRIIGIVGNVYCFAANPIFVASWCVYTDLRLYHSNTRVKHIYTKAFIPAVIMVVVALLNLFLPIIFFLDENNVYYRLPLSYAYYAVDVAYIAMSIFILKGYERRYGKVRFFPMYLMVSPIAIGCALQLIFYGVSLIWVSLAIGLTSIYMSLQNEFSYLDRLTGLYNRAYLDYQLDTATKSAGSKLGGIMIDVDHFKEINDTYGHSVGDEALIDVARVITLSKPDKAIATRFAGDEFILLVKNTSDKEMTRIMDSIHDEVRLFNETENRQYQLSLSLGYSIYDHEKDTVDDFLKNMDDNMYEEKNVKHSNDN